MALVLLFGGGAYAYYTPYAELSLDINPSIAIKTNIFDTVIDVQALNDDAEQILTPLQIRNCNLQTALDAILDRLISEGYLSEEDAADIMLTAYSQDQERAQVMLQEMTQILEQDMARERLQANIEGECIGSEIRIRAQQYGVSPGKLMLAERYAQSTGDPDAVDITQWLSKPVREIMEAIRNNGADNGFGNGSGGANAQNAGSANPNVTADSNSGNGYGGNEKRGRRRQRQPVRRQRRPVAAAPRAVRTRRAPPRVVREPSCSADPSCPKPVTV